MLIEKIKNFNIYLASQSPRRQELLKDLGLDFSIASKINVDETAPATLSGVEVALYLSEKKSDAYFQILKDNRLLITADTIVIVDDSILGKPIDENQAVEMLQQLSGRKHSVVTSVTLRTLTKKVTFYEETDVWFKKLTDDEINYYVNKYKPFDKAGAYGIQEWIGYIGVERIDGSFFNVMGFPIQKFYVELEKFIDAQ